MAVSKEQIFKAADQLADDGKRPTLEGVRAITGGSYTTISPALNEWKAQRVAANAPLKDPAPQAVSDKLSSVGAEIWTTALELANDRLATEREALEKARRELEADRDEATGLADNLAEKVETLQAECKDLEARVASLLSLESQLKELKAELVQSRQEAMQAREEAARLAGQLEGSKEQVDALLSRLPPAGRKPSKSQRATKG